MLKVLTSNLYGVKPLNVARFSLSSQVPRERTGGAPRFYPRRGFSLCKSNVFQNKGDCAADVMSDRKVLARAIAARTRSALKPPARGAVLGHTDCRDRFAGPVLEPGLVRTTGAVLSALQDEQVTGQGS